MDPIEILRNEHGLIRRFVDLLSVAVTRLEVDDPPPRAFFDNGIEFVRGFSDGFHHKKEELVMFVQLAQKEKRRDRRPDRGPALPARPGPWFHRRHRRVARRLFGWRSERHLGRSGKRGRLCITSQAPHPHRGPHLFPDVTGSDDRGRARSAGQESLKRYRKSTAQTPSSGITSLSSTST